MFIYLASPYSHAQAGVRDLRYLKARDFAITLVQQGIAVHSPIVHWHTVAVELSLPFAAHNWKEQNFSVIKNADQMWVLMLDGWDKSVGIKEELEFARQIRKVVKLINPDNGFMTMVKESESGEAS